MKHSIDGRCIVDEQVASNGHEQTDELLSRSPQVVGLDCPKRKCGYSSLINEDGQTKLHLLCQNNSCSVEEVQDLLSAFPAAINKRDVYGRSVR
jgi:hypothetical protein